MRGLLAAGTFAVTTRFGTGCTPAPSATGEASPGADTKATGGDAAKTVNMGFIYVGAKDDYGWNQAHAEGAKSLSSLGFAKAIEEASVPETTSVEETMLNMINQDGIGAIFATSFGYFDPYVLKLAKENSSVQFFHCSTLYQEGKTPTNVGTYYADVDEAQYVAGIVAASTSKTKKLGFVAAKPINPVLRNINSWTMGARSVDPKVTVQVVFTGDWSLPVKEAEAVNSLADQGIDVVGVHVDSPKVVVETAEKRGIFSSGFHADQSALAPKGYLTGTAWDWSTIYTEYANLLSKGKTLMDGGIPHQLRGSLKEKYVKLAPYGVAVSDKTKALADATIAKFVDGSLVMYKGPIKDNKGTVQIPAGTQYKVDAPELNKVDWLVEGAIGSIGS